MPTKVGNINKVTPTERQKRAFDKLVEVSRRGGSKGQALVEAGYTPKTAIAPTKVTRSRGFQVLCEERGLTEKFLVDALIEDIEKKPQNRKPELELAFRVTGTLKESNNPMGGFQQQNIFIFNDEAKERAKGLIENYLRDPGDDRDTS